MNQQRSSIIALIMAVVMIVMQPLECFSESILGSGSLENLTQPVSEIDRVGNASTPLPAEELVKGDGEKPVSEVTTSNLPTSNVSTNNVPTAENIVVKSVSENTVTSGSAVITGGGVTVTSGAALNIDAAILEGMNNATEMFLGTWNEDFNADPTVSKWYKFSVPENGDYEITLYSTADVNGIIYRADGSRWKSFSHYRGTRASLNNFNFKSGEIYYIQMKSLATEGCRFKFLMKKAVVSNSEIVLAQDELKAGKIEKMTQEDNYLIQVSETNEYLIEMTAHKNLSFYMRKKIDDSYVYLDSIYDSANPSTKKSLVQLEKNVNYVLKVVEHGRYDFDNNFAAIDYTVKLSRPDNLSIVDDYGDNKESAAALTLDQEITGAISTKDDKDYFKFIAPESGLYSLKKTQELEFYWISTNHNRNPDASWITLGKDEVAYLEVSGMRGKTGCYNFKLSKIDTSVDDHGDTYDTATNGVVGENVIGKVNYGDDVDYFKYVPTELGAYRININGYVDCVIEDSEHNELSNYEVILRPNETYFLRVYSRLEETPYEITFEKLSSHIINDMGSAQTLEINQEKSASIENEGEKDYFKITIPNDGEYTFKSKGNLDTFGTLFNSECKQLASNDDTNGNNFEISKKLLKGQTVYLEVNCYSNSQRGEYGVLVTCKQSDIPKDDHDNNMAYGTLLEIGQKATGKIDYLGDKDCFKFTATEEDL